MRAPPLVPLILLGLLGVARADREGRADSLVIGGNFASARARALLGAQQDCLMQVITEELGAERAGQERVRLTPLLSRAERFLHTYRVLEEGQQAQRFVVRLACTVDEPRLRRALEPVSPRSESWQLRLEPGPGVSPELSTSLLQRARAGLERGGLRLAEATVAAAATLELRVQLVAEPAIRGLGWPARRASVRISNAADGVILGEPVESFAATAVEAEADRLAAQRALDQAVAGALPLLIRGSAKARVELRLTGVRNVADLQQVRSALEGVGASVRLRAIAGQEVELEGDAAGGASALAAALRGRGWGGGLSLAQQRISGGALWLTFAAR